MNSFAPGDKIPMWSERIFIFDDFSIFLGFSDFFRVILDGQKFQRYR
jgi:hypothetical protein